MKKVIVYLLTVLTATNLLHAQPSVSLPFSSFYDEDAWLSMGLQYNYVNSVYKIGLKENWGSMGTSQTINPANRDLYMDRFQAIESAVSHGMSVGIPIEIRFTDNLSSMIQPSFMFINNQGIEFSGRTEDGEERHVTRRMRHEVNNTQGSNFNSLEFPFSLRFRSDEKMLKNKFHRYRGYVSLGTRYTRWIDISGEYKQWSNVPLENRPQTLIFKPGYFSWEAGIGVEIFFPFFRVSPEIKFIQSLGDVLDHSHILSQENAFMAPLGKTQIKNIQFSLIFQ
ncbi:PorT [Sphingobacterium sp. LRF_L2]|uniref:PorT n=1 Tax=Sphingobacterium sp. LRF_L2 TaxID=3369421 RepID=UPI003F5F3C14